MNGFYPFVPATADAAACQTYFIRGEGERDKPATGRAFFRLSRPASGPRSFRLWFSNALDSTFGPGQNVLANAFCEAWDIESASAWLVKEPVRDAASAVNVRPENAAVLTFDGKPSFHAEPGMVFACDPFTLSSDYEHTFAFELTFRGHILPCHQETLVPVLLKETDTWKPDVRMPLPVMIGEEREEIPVVGFLGDSITQGIGSGSPDNAFPFLVQQAIGPENAVWNLGIGYARAADAATDGFWLHRARQCDKAVVCLGVNDVGQGFPSGTVCANLKKALLALRESGCGLYLLTPPPFDFAGEQRAVWEDVRYYCKEELSRIVKAVVTTDSFLAVSDAEPWKAKYGPHPDADGHRLLAEAVVRALSE